MEHVTIFAWHCGGRAIRTAARDPVECIYRSMRGWCNIFWATQVKNCIQFLLFTGGNNLPGVSIQTAHNWTAVSDYIAISKYREQGPTNVSCIDLRQCHSAEVRNTPLESSAHIRPPPSVLHNTPGRHFHSICHFVFLDLTFKEAINLQFITAYRLYLLFLSLIPHPSDNFILLNYSITLIYLPCIPIYAI